MMLYMGVLWFICSIPIITVGAATSAMYEVFLQAIKNQEGYIGKSFFKAFKLNLKQGTKIWIPILFAEVVFGINIFYYGLLGGEAYKLQTAIFSILFLVIRAVSAYIFAAVAKFENSSFGHVKMAFILARQNWGWTLIIVFIQTLSLFLIWFFVYFPVLFIMGVTGYMEAIIFDHIFQRMIESGLIQERNQSY
ncbi:MAG: YesL family protein [Lachnospiraceae bacterium]|nr:YesL family protein [Lachnospiraceae bacterium]